MNVLDYSIIAILIIFVLAGLHGGFIVSICNLAAFFVSLFGAYLWYPKLSAWMDANNYIYPTLRYYVEGSEKIVVVGDRMSNVANLSPDVVSNIVEKSQNLPTPLDSILKSNITGKVFAGTDIVNIGQYYNETITIFIANIICFLILFLIIRIALAIIVHGLNYVVRFPVLKQFDSVIGGAFGFVRGVFVIFVVCMIVPAIITMIPVPPVDPTATTTGLRPDLIISKLFDDSAFGSLFFKSNFLTNMIKGIY